MASERIQRQIDRLLDEAEEAVRALDWTLVAERARAVLALDQQNADATAFLDAAQREAEAASDARARSGQDSHASPPVAGPGAAERAPLPASFGAGRYLVRSFLGEGGKKRVYLTHDSRLDRDVAFALIKTDGLDADGLVRVGREAQAMGRLGDHPRIVTVYDTGDERGAPYIVTQHMPGGSVEDLVARAESNRLPPERAMRIAEHVCEALQHAHERGIVHRDIKPGNVWLSEDGTMATVGDFGLAIALDRSRMTVAGMMVGTVAYMAPEQALGRAPDVRSDLYSLGAMLYEMVTGRPPFLGDDAVRVISQHVNTAPVSPVWHNPEVPRPLEVLVLRLLAKSPEDRPASAADVAQELRRILARASLDPVLAPQPDSRLDLRVLDWGQFVGRHNEMDQLKAALEDVLSGNGAMTFIAGEPGIGKTRLAEEFAVYAGLRGVQVLTGHCYEGESSLPYRPFVEAFRQYVRSRPDQELREQLGPGAPEVATLVSEIRQRFPDIPEAPPLEAEAERLRLFESVTQFVRNAATATPLMLLVDDLHWADRASLQLLQQIARTTVSDRVLIAGTYRDIDLDRQHPLADTLATLRRQPNFQRILLRGLHEQAVDDLLASIEPSEETAPGRRVIAAALHRETEGNPFFVREILSHLVEEGKIHREGGRWQARVNVSEMGIPEGVREVIGRRLSRLGDTCNQMLTLVSTMSGGFTWDELKAVSDRPEAELLDLLEEALAAQIIAEQRGGLSVRYEFVHALFRQTLYEEVSTPRRVMMHRKIGEALEELYAPNIEPHVAEIAHHFFQAAPGGDVAKAIEYATRAGDRAAALNGHEDAVGHYERALQAMDTFSVADDGRRCALFLKLGDVQRRAGQPARALDTFREAASIARRISHAELLGRAAIGFAETAWRVHGDTLTRPDAVRILEEALAALGERDDALRVKALALHTMAARSSQASDLADALATGGMPTYLGGRDEEHVARAREAVAIAERLGDPALQSFALFHLRGALWRPENPEERLQLSDASLRLAVAAGDVSREFDARVWRCVDVTDLGQLDDLAAEVREMERLSKITREPAHRYYPLCYSATLAMAQGDFARAEPLIFQALQAGQGVAAEAIPAFGGQLNTLRLDQGRVHEVEQLFIETEQQSPNQAVYKAVLANLYAQTGRRVEARRYFDMVARDNFANVPRDFLFLVTLGYLSSDPCEFLDDRDRALLLYELLEPLAHLSIGTSAISSSGSVSRALGQLAGLLGRWEDAETHFHHALDFNARTGHPVALARTRMNYARMLLRRDAPDDRTHALELLGEALEAAQEIGMAKVVEDCLALKLQAQGIDLSSVQLRRSMDALAIALHAERPDLAPMASPDGTVTIMFSDIEGSTPLAERLGDEGWLALLREHNAIVRKHLSAHDGYEVKTIGDAFMVVFQSAKKGLDCAMAIQRAVAESWPEIGDGEWKVDASRGHPSSIVHPPSSIRVRIGLHTGEALKDADDFYGKNVILASRIADAARGGEILVSSLLHQLVESAVDGRVFSAPRSLELKGLSGTHTVYAVQPD